MTGGAIVVMIIGIVIIWGGLGLSIAHAMKSSKKVDQKTRYIARFLGGCLSCTYVNLYGGRLIGAPP